MHSRLQISTIDLTIILVYLAGVLLLGLWVVRRQKMTAGNYFLAGRSLNWAFVGAALFASNISTIHMVGLAAAGYSDGIVQGNFEWLAPLLLILLGLVFAPFYFKNRISTLPEFLEKRYNGLARSLLAFMALMGALFMHIGISLYAGAVVFQDYFGINMWISILLIAGITAAYTILGGLKSVVFTETAQTVILIIGGLVLAVMAVFALGDNGIHSLAQLRDAVKPDQLTLLRSYESSPKLPWYSLLLGYPVIGIWYWCADQTIVQRVLGARSLDDARRGPVFAGFIKLLTVFMMVIPGIIAYAIFRTDIKNPNDTLPVLITKLLPVGFIGLLSAALLSALMSTIAAALNSSATLVSVDIVKRIRPETSDRKQVRIGRWTAAVVMLLAIAWSPMIGKFISIFDAINQILAVLSPPIATVFLLGVFWKRGNATGAVAAIIGGFVLGVLAFVIDFPMFGNVKVISEGLHIPYMLQSFLLFVISSLIFVGVSLVTDPPPRGKIASTTLDSPLAFLKGRITGIGDPRILSLILITILIGLYIVFQ
ncbi:MAG: sodium:solute symporter [Bacteroidales bacterium]|nr:sodium:solute symporter [Bacteroidales bacterium]